jgi:VanZ family protein
MKENFFYRWFPVFLWAILIFITSANQNPFRSLPPSWVQKVVPVQADPGLKITSRYELLSRYLHAAEFLVLAVLIARALVWRGDPRPVLLAMAIGLSALYALSDETHQLFVPRRAFELSDLALDLGGTVFGVVIYATLLTLWRRRVR